MSEIKTATHWVMDEKARAAFWQRAKELGFDHAAVHAALGVTSLKDFKGTETEAAGVLVKKRAELDKAAPQPPVAPPELEPLVEPELQPVLAMDDEQAAFYGLACKDLPEAPAVAWVKMQTPAGFIWSVTVRAGLPAELETQAMGSITRQIGHFEKCARAANWLPVVDGRDSLGLGQRGEPTAAPTNGKPATLPPASKKPPQGGQSTALTFDAEKLVANVNEGTTYWKVKGGKFSKFGVTIWSEVLIEAGFDPNELDPSVVYDLAGYTAHYVLNDKGSASKVTLLTKAT